MLGLYPISGAPISGSAVDSAGSADIYLYAVAAVPEDIWLRDPSVSEISDEVPMPLAGPPLLSTSLNTSLRM